MTLFGWDASHFDWGRGPMDVTMAVKAGISFLTHKASEGTGYTDARYAAAAARARGVVPVFGAYHVLHTGNIDAQVDHYLSVLRSSSPWWQSGPFLVQLDCERWPTDFPQRADIAAWCARFVAVTGGSHRPVLYASRGQYGGSLAGLDYPLWNAAYPSSAAGTFRALYPGDVSPNWAPYSGQHPQIWQYSDNTTIGSQTGCDANAFRGTVQQLQALTRFQTISTPAEGADVTPEEHAILTEIQAVTRALFWAWNPTKEQYLAAGGTLANWNNVIGGIGGQQANNLVPRLFAALPAAGAGPSDEQVNAAVLAALQDPRVQQGIADKVLAGLEAKLAAAVAAAGTALS